MDQRTKAKKVFVYYWKKVAVYPWVVAGVVVSLPLTVLANSYLPPLILANVLSKLSRHEFDSHSIWGSFGPQIVFYILLLFVGQFLWRIVDKFAWTLEGRVQKAIPEEVLDHLLDESTDFHANHFTGSLVSQTNKLMGSYVRTADTTIFNTYPTLLGIIIACTILAFRAPIYSFILFTFSALFIMVSFRISRPVREAGAKLASSESRQTGFLADAITNVIAVKSFSRGAYERRRFEKITTKNLDLLGDLSKLHIKQMNILGVLSRSMGSAALVMAIVGVVVLKNDIATVFLIFSYTASLADQLFNFSNNSLRNYNRSVGDAYDMVETLAQTPKVRDSEHARTARFRQGDLVFKDVEFSHETDGKSQKDPLFKNFNLNIEPGEKVGLVGHSGGGKTTLTKLILRFMDVNGGAVLIDGQNIADLTQDSLRRAIAYVPQEPLLFHRTLAENISYGKPDAKQAEIVKAAKLAHAHDFISELPNGYDTLVGERGIKLSGGQRQRIAIARAMLKDAPILLLDEATSALDSDSEKLIQRALWKLMEGRTTVVIAHRLSTIQRMDRIVVLEEGKVAEQGSHKELLNQGGIYATLWAHQSGGFLEE